MPSMLAWQPSLKIAIFKSLMTNPPLTKRQQNIYHFCVKFLEKAILHKPLAYLQRDCKPFQLVYCARHVSTKTTL